MQFCTFIFAVLLQSAQSEQFDYVTTILAVSRSFLLVRLFVLFLACIMFVPFHLLYTSAPIVEAKYFDDRETVTFLFMRHFSHHT